MTTYGALKSQIEDETLRPDLATQIAYAIQTAIREYQPERWWFAEATYWTTTTPGDPIITPPTDLIAVDLLEVVRNNSRYEVKQIDYETYRAWAGGSTVDSTGTISNTTGEPAWWAQYREKILVYPTPDAAYRLWLSYRTGLSDLSEDSDSNGWTTEAADLIRNAAKRILYTDVIDDERKAALSAAAENRALAALRRRSLARTATGRIKATCF